MGVTEDFVLISDADIKNLRFDNLRAELKKRGLGRGALKENLLKRLQQAMIANVQIKNDKATEVANTNIFQQLLTGRC